MNQKKQIVILGAGFAGIYSALSILKSCGESVEITIINRTNYFLFTPMLHEVATGGLGHHQVVESIREIIYKTPIQFLEATVFSVDLAKKEVVTDHGNRPYDMLVVGIGASTNFFNTPGAEKYSKVLKNLSDAISIRDYIIERFEAASRETNKEDRRKMLTFVVVGGGATGVEFAAELSEFCKHTFRKYYKHLFPGECAHIVLVHSGKELLGPFSVETRERAKKSLEKKGVVVMLNAKVTDVDEDHVTLADNTVIDTKGVIWTAGVRANTLHTEGGELPKDASGRIMTDMSLSVVGHPDIFALGDVAHVPDVDGVLYPMLAQIAVAEAMHLGKNISRHISGEELEPFAYKTKGTLVSLGQWEAAGTIGTVNLYGKFAWFIWRTIYLFKFISWSKKIKIAVDWTIHLFFPRDVTRM